MKAIAKVGIICGGYLAAFGIAPLAVTLYIAATSNIDRVTYSGMSACGDSLVFLFAFGAAAVAPTAIALFFLRPYRQFWSVLSAVALAIAATGLIAGIDYVAAGFPNASAVVQSWSAFAVLRIIVAPLFAGAFCLAGLFAPNRNTRTALLLATVMDATGFTCAAFTLIWRAT